MMSSLKLAASAAVALLALVAPAQAATTPKPATEPPSRWAKTPTPDQFRQMRAAAGVQPDSRAILRCHVDVAGAISDCATASEMPGGSGYGRALATLAPYFQMKPEAVKTEGPTGVVYLSDDTFRADNEPTWLRKPTPYDLVAVWPKAALAKHRGGKALINCLVSVQGALFDCIAFSETPPGENFGAAAIALTPQFLMKPGAFKGKPVVTQVNIPINFQMDAGGGEPIRYEAPGRQTALAAMAWVEAPSYADMAAAYPKKARDAHLSGRATVDCAFTIAGALTNCTTITEEPKGQGFGAAARALAHQFKAPAEIPLKTLKAANVQIPFAFDASVLTDEKPAIGQPKWAALPDGAETAAAFDAVTKAGVRGTVRVMLNCTVQPGGGVAGCKVAREDPLGRGVGQAALSLAPRFKITTWTTEGLPTVGGTVNIPLRYEGPAADAGAVAAKP